MLTAADIKKARISLGESQTAFAERFGVDQSTAHRWETDGPPTRGPARKALQSLIDDLAKQSQPEAAE